MSERRRLSLDHPDPAQLLASADGELPFWQAWRVRRHVERCWQCRARISGFEASIHAVSRELAPAEVTPTELAKAKWQFRASVSELESTNLTSLLPRPSTWPFAAAGIAAAAVLVVVGLVGFWTPDPPSAEALLREAITAEASAAATVAAVHEDRFTVEYPNTRRELRLLRAPAAGTWTARWSDEKGQLRHAVFAAERHPGAEFTQAGGLRPAVFERSAQHQGLLSLQGREDIEQMVLGWIRRQAWQPVSLARELSEFCTRSGAVLTVSISGAAVVWRAEASVDGIPIRVVLEGSANDEPRVLSVRWGDRLLRIRRAGRRDYPTVQMAAQWLYPPQAVAVVRKEKVPDPVIPEVAIPSVVYPSERELIAAEVAVVFALHNERLCKADAVRVVRSREAVMVTGAFADADMLDRMTALLGGIADVRLQFTTVDASAVAFGPVAEESVRAVGQIKPAAAEPWLRARLGVGVQSSEREMFDAMNAIVQDAEGMRGDSWALVHLAERFPADIEARMDAAALLQLRAMVQAHVTEVGGHLDAVDNRLALRDSSLSGDAGIAGVWQDAVPELHTQVRHAAELALQLFTSGQGSGDTLQVSADPEHAGLGMHLAAGRQRATELRNKLLAGR